MTKVDVFSGFLGAGKTTLIKKLIAEAYAGEKLVLIENEFGEIGVDGGFMKDAGIEVTEMNSGCICCSLVGDFSEALKKVLKEYGPDRIVIEPSGVGKLSDVVRAVLPLESDSVRINSRTVVADATKCRIYMKNFGEFYDNQIENAGAIILSRTSTIAPEKLDTALSLIREHNGKAIVVTTPWDKLDGKKILEAMENGDHFAEELLSEEEICPECGHHHGEDEHHHDHDHCCGHDHDEDHDHDEHEHHDHDHDNCCDHDHDHCHHDHDHDDDHDHDEHEHHHDHDCCCGHDHGHHHHHHADEVFTSWGVNTAKKYSSDEIKAILDGFTETNDFGAILRAKGIVEGTDGEWIYFDYVPGEADVRTGAADVTGKLCVIGSSLNEEKLAQAFGV